MHSSASGSGQGNTSWFWVIVALVAVTLVCGTIGIHRYEVDHHPEGTRHGLSAPYGALQMLILHTPHFDHGVNLWLEVGRWAGAAVVFLAALTLFWRRLRRGEHLIRLLRFSGHYVICGLGRKGLEIVNSQARKDPKSRFVVVDPNPDPHLVESIMRHRVVVVSDDAAQPASLERARVAHAAQVVVVTPEDARNVAIASAVRAQLPGRSVSNGVQCHVHLSDIDLRESLDQWDETAGRSRAGCRMHFFDVFDNEARRVLSEHPLDLPGIDRNSAQSVHVAILGFGRMARMLTLRALKMGHFANGKPLKVSVITRDARLEEQRFLFRYPALAGDDVATRGLLGSLEFLAGEAQSLVARKQVLKWAGDPATRFHLFVCLDDDARAVEVALRLRTALTGCGGALFVRLHSRDALSPIVRASERGGIPVVPFGMVEDSCAEEAYLRPQHEALAKAIHERFVRDRLTDSPRRAENDSALRNWDDLREDLRESNRQQADHLPVKLRAIGCELVRLSDPRPALTRFSDDEIEALAPMEHARWNVERLLAGWRLGSPSNKDLQINENILPWDRLTPEIQGYDRAAVRNISSLLQESKFDGKIVRVTCG